MKIVKRIAIAIVAVVVVAALVAFLLPRQASVSRTIEVAAPADAIFPLVGDLRRFNEWSPWADRDPAAVYTFTGPVDGVGQTMNWRSDKPDVGTGSMRVERLDPGKEVDLTLDFGAGGPATAAVLLAPDGTLTKVTWSFTADLGYNPVARYFGLMIDGMVGPDYERGLARLKAVAETAQLAPATASAPAAPATP